MKRAIIGILLLIIIKAAAFTQIINGDFETGSPGQYTGGNLEGWWLLFWDQGMGNYYLDGDVKYEGEHSLKVEVVSAGSNPRMVYASNWQISGENVNAGDVLTVRFFARSDLPGKQINIDIRPEGVQRNLLTKVFTLSANFEEYTMSFRPDADGSYGIHIGFAYETGEYWIDDISYEVQSNSADQQKSVYYVSVESGSDANPGTKEQPFKSIAAAMEVLNGNDSCYIMEGSYREEVRADGLIGDRDYPIVICAYPGHKVTLDGSLDLDPVWEPYQDNIYRTTLDTVIWQLWVDGKSMTSARWPNVEVFSPETWSRKGWAKQASSSTLGNMVDDESYMTGSGSLASQGVSFEGALAVLNVGYWVTGCELVDSHAAGSNTFTYDENVDGSEFFQWYESLYGSWYFLEAHPACLDAPGEWYFDPDTRELFLYPYDGLDPSGKTVKGKTQTYGLEINNSSHVIIRGLDFFGTTIKLEQCTFSTVEDCDFLYPSYSRRMLGFTDDPQITTLVSGKKSLSADTLRNCTFAYADGGAFEVMGSGNVVENCHIHDMDYSCTYDGSTISGGNASGSIFRRNTIHSCGSSKTIDGEGIYEYNHIQNCGMLQGDGTCFQIGPSQYPSTIYRYNWLHDTYKRGVRFDDGGRNSTTPGYGARVHHNVIWNCTYQGLNVKGDSNYVYNNVSFNNDGIDLNIKLGHNASNHYTKTRNNLAGTVSASESQAGGDLPGIVTNNWFEQEKDNLLEDQLRDVVNRDFRPVIGGEIVDAAFDDPEFTGDYSGYAPDIGAYEFGDSLYWIPGYRFPHASSPVPSDGGTSSYEFVDLLWLEGYRALSHDVYFGSSDSLVRFAGKGSPEYKSTQRSNIFNPGALEAGQKYYWRIDAQSAEGSVKGDVWSFTAGADANPLVYHATFLIYSKKDGVVSPLDSAEINFGGRRERSGPDGEAKLSMLKEGSYPLKISRKGFTSIQDTIYINSDTLLSDTLDFTTYSLRVLVRDKDSGEGIPGAVLRFEEREYLSDSIGIVGFDSIEYNRYKLSASALDYIDGVEHEVEVYSDTLIHLELVKDYLETTLKLIDRVTGEPVYRVVVSYDDQTKLSNNSGLVLCDKLLSGSWAFRLEHEDYFLLEDTIFLQGDSMLTVELTPRLAALQFIISDSNGPLSGALVSLNGLQFLTDQEGSARFLSRPAREEYRYHVEKEGYETVMDSLWLEIDTSLMVLLNPVTSVKRTGRTSISFWPNPVKDKLNFISNMGAAELRLLSMDGRVLIIREIFEESGSVDVSRLQDGAYILLLRTREGEHASLITIQK